MVVAALVPPVMVSPLEKVPTGMVVATALEVGLLVIIAVAALVPHVMVSPTEKLPEADTDKVKVPAGYSLTPEATVIEGWSIVHWLSPRFAQSANNKFMDRLAVFKS